MSNDTEPRPGTTASIDARVGRLEDQVTGLVTKVEVIQAEAGHTRELMSAGFTTVRAQQDLVGTKLDGLVQLLAARHEEAIAAMSDPQATAAGRGIYGLVTEAQRRQREIERKVWMATGGLLVVTFLINLLAPAVRGVLGLP